MGSTISEWDFSTLWRLCIESPSQPKLASSLPNKRLSYWRLTGSDRNDRGGRLCTSISERNRMAQVLLPSTVISNGAARRYEGKGFWLY